MRLPSSGTLIRESPVLFIVCATLLLVVAGVAHVVVPAYNQYVKNNAEYAYYQNKISSENGYAEIKQSISGKLDTLRSKLSGDPAIPDISPDLSSYLEQLIALARQSDISFVRMQPQESLADSLVVNHPVLLELSTTYHELGNFITAVERLPLLFHIDRLSLDAAKNNRCNVRLLITCKLSRGAKS